jgi:hypothetical protein
MLIEVAGIKYREIAWDKDGKAFPWEKIGDGDAIQVIPDPKGTAMMNPHNDPYALALVHTESATFIGYVPHATAKVLDAEFKAGRKVSGCTVADIQPGTLQKGSKLVTVDLQLE